MLHYSEAPSDTNAFAPRVAALDDALLLLRHAVPPADRPDPTALGSLEAALDGYLGTVRDMLASPSDEAPPPPPTDGLARTAPDADRAVAEAAAERASQRRLLHAIVRQSGHRWPSGAP